MYLYSQFGKSPFLALEFKSRLRKLNELITYPETIDSETDIEQDDYLHISAPTDVFSQSDEEKEEDSVSSVMDDSDDDSRLTMDDNTHLTLTVNAVELIQDYEDDGYDSECSSGTAEEIEPTEEQIRAVPDLCFNATLEKIISDADKLTDFDADHEVVMNQINEDGLQINELPKILRYKSVLGDISHFMDRAKLPMYHEFKALFFRALRASIFIMYKQGVKDIRTLLEGKGITWEQNGIQL